MSYDPEGQVEDEFRGIINELGAMINEDLSGLEPSRAREGFGFMAVPLHNYIKKNPNILNVIESLKPRGLIKGIKFCYSRGRVT